MSRTHPRLHARRPSPLRLYSRAAVVLAFGWTAFAPARASADEPFFGKPSATITETTVLKYRFDNRNTKIDDDKYGEWLNRLNLQATSGRFTAALRIDSAVYFLRPNPNELARTDLAKAQASGQPVAPNFLQNRTLAYGQDMSDRYIDAVYPSKYNLTYQHRGLEVTAGDYYVQFGRGLVLAVRKIDELVADTTLRGGKIVYNPNLGKFKLNLMGIAGASNPIRVDDVTGRLLSQRTGTSLEKIGFPAMPQPNDTTYVPNPGPTFAPDVIVGAQAEGGLKSVQLGVRAIQLDRTAASFQMGSDAAGPTRNADKIMMASVSLNAPSIYDHGSFYFELAGQSLRNYVGSAADDPTGSRAELLARASGGYAAYAFATAYDGPFTLSLEGKHYDRFYPVLANVGGTGAVEFGAVQYNIPPTTDPFTADFHFGSYNVCVTGARARLDARLTDQTLLYASLGRYRSYSESSIYCGRETVDANGNAPGKTPGLRNDKVDPFVGFEMNFEQSRSHAFVSTGVHFDDSAIAHAYIGANGEPISTSVFYRENWVRYSLLKKIAGPWSAEMSGWHRYRYYPAERATPWREGENYLSAIWSPKLTVAIGYEYSTKEDSWKHFINGMIQWRFTPASFVRLFVGQNRPALRCISGVCRQFPSFEGARLEATVAY